LRKAASRHYALSRLEIWREIHGALRFCRSGLRLWSRHAKALSLGQRSRAAVAARAVRGTLKVWKVVGLRKRRLRLMFLQEGRSLVGMAVVGWRGCVWEGKRRRKEAGRTVREFYDGFRCASWSIKRGRFAVLRRAWPAWTDYISWVDGQREEAGRRGRRWVTSRGWEGWKCSCARGIAAKKHRKMALLVKSLRGFIVGCRRAILWRAVCDRGDEHFYLVGWFGLFENRQQARSDRALAWSHRKAQGQVMRLWHRYMYRLKVRSALARIRQGFGDGFRWIVPTP
jgi:hypothetical protein